MHARFPAWILVSMMVSVLAFAAGCGDDPAAPENVGQITVWAHDGETPVAGVLAEILEENLSGTTGADGKVRFVVAPGTYTVRVHNTSSQLPPWFDHHVDLRRGEQPVIDADYCWTCS